MGQIERAANRLYGIQRDRPSLRKYLRAAGLAFAGGVPAMLGFLLLVAGGSVIDSLRAVYGLPEHVATALQWLRWPAGALLDLLAITVLFRWAPRRRQPGMSWLAVGAGLSLLLWLTFSGALALYVASSGSFGQVYGPLTGIIALLLWSQLTSIALLLGLAFAAQLEAVRAGVPAPAGPDPEADDEQAVARPRHRGDAVPPMPRATAGRPPAT
jgi:YihY family inner membrane protein